MISMLKTLGRWCAGVIFLCSSLLVSPSPVRADGGPITSDPRLWAQLEEGQQVAVVTLGKNNTVDIDLFISMRDKSGQLPEIVFFLPLGIAPSNFSVKELMSREFDGMFTWELDNALLREPNFKNKVRLSLLPGLSLSSGAWAVSLPLAAIIVPNMGRFLGGDISPEATYQTESSRVSVYGIDEDTDLEALVKTTGLDPGVQEALSRLRGQRIAVVTLKPQPRSKGEESPFQPTGEPGIHLRWTAALASSSTYSYPLGTGSAWAHPIGITRVYIVAPIGVDFKVKYPKLGSNCSGFSGRMPNIMHYSQGSDRRAIYDYYPQAYAVDDARSDFGRVWRAIYTESNPTEDIVITVRSGGIGNVVKGILLSWGVLIGLVAGLLLLLTGWRYLMPRLLGMEYSWRNLKLWRHSLLYPAINGAVIGAATLAALLLLFFVLSYFGTEMEGFLNASLLIISIVAAGLLLSGVPGALFFLRRQRHSVNASAGRIVVAYIVVSLIINSAYLAFAVGYLALAGVS